jgi:hypothetical protein
MEVEEVTAEEVSNPEGNTRECDHCGTSYVFRSTKSKFCSDACRNKAGNKLRKQAGNHAQKPASDKSDDSYMEEADVMESAPQQTRLSGNLRGLDAQSQYIITHQQSIINDLKERRRSLERKLDETTTRKIELEKKLDRIELEQSLNISAKSGLNGLGENPMILKLLDYAGPALGAWALKTVEGGGSPASPQLTGLTPEVQRQVDEISKWYASQPAENQALLYFILNTFAESDPEKLPALLERIQNLLKNGTATTSANQYTGTFN